jgi:hypothetical protein
MNVKNLWMRSGAISTALVALLTLSSACAKNDAMPTGIGRPAVTGGVGAPRPSSAGPTAAALPVIDGTCTADGQRACAENGSKLALICTGTAWKMAAACGDGQACSNGPGEHHGTCRPVLAQCEERALGQSFCVAGAVRSCVDRVSFEDKTCDERSVCRLEGDAARCACAPGFTDVDGTCTDIDECATQNGGCDAEAPCKNNPGGHTCGGCALGYLGGKDGVCTPALIDLVIAPGAMTPGFRAAQHDYFAVVPLTAAQVDLTATAPADATITINGKAAESGKPWRSDALVLGDTEFTIVVSRPEFPSSTYKLLVTRGEGQDGYLKPEATRPGDGFGASLALGSGLLVVGAPGEDGGASGEEEPAASVAGSGAAYVFQRVGNGWQQLAYLKAEQPTLNAAFGTMVAISGDTIVVGAPGYAYVPPAPEPAAGEMGEMGEMAGMGAAAPPAVARPTAYQAGAAYVFVREGDTWVQQAVLTADAPSVADYFGSVLAISGDTIVVGAPRESSDSETESPTRQPSMLTNSGAAYVFVRDEDMWTQQAVLKAETSRARDGFGSAVAIDQDTIVIGALRGNTEAERAVVAPPEAAAAGAAAPAPAAPDTMTAPAVPVRPAAFVASIGAAYVFERDGVSWSQAAELKSDAANPGARFGYHVGISGSTIIVGAPGEATQLPPPARVEPDPAAEGAPAEGMQPEAAPTAPARWVTTGAAHIFVRGRRGWTEQARLVASTDPAVLPSLSGDAFGASVKIVEDTVLIGAFREDSNAAGLNGDRSNNTMTDSGAAYLFTRTGKQWSEPIFIKASNTRRNDEFARHTALSREGIAIGASSEDSGARGIGGNQADTSAPNSGAVYSFR